MLSWSVMDLNETSPPKSWEPHKIYQMLCPYLYATEQMWMGAETLWHLNR